MTTLTMTDAEVYKAWVGRYRAHLQPLPALLDHMRTSTMYSALTATPTDVPHVGGSQERTMLPWKGDGVDDADILWSLLVIYATEVAELTGGASPSILRDQHRRGSEVAGFRASAGRVVTDAQVVVEWLLVRVDLTLEHPELDDSERQLLDAIRAARGKYGFGPVRVSGPLRICLVCGAQQVVLTWHTAADGGSTTRGRCRVCGDRTGGDE